MFSLKKCIKKNNEILLKFYKKDYLTFVLRNNNKHTYKFIYKRLNSMLLNFSVYTFKEKIFVNVNIDINSYFFVKNNVVSLLNSENFSFKICSVKFNNNILDIHFFEKSLIFRSDKIKLIQQIFLFAYINFIYSDLVLKINLFMLVNIFFKINNTIKCITYKSLNNNVHDSSSSF